MVRVLECHHFTAQDVFKSDHEPVATHTTEKWLFVATTHCYVEVYDLTQEGCPRVYRFPTVGLVRSMQYSDTDNFLATIEEKSQKKHRQSNARVYLNWQADQTSGPMSVRVAGQTTSSRQSTKNEENQFIVVEIPLKYDDPKCLALDGSTGNLALGVAKKVLIYGLCYKTVADTDAKYEDMRCLLELEFSFPIRSLAICEEFIVCSSENKLQVVKLNLKNVPGISEVSMRDRHKENCSQNDSKSEKDISDSGMSDSSFEQLDSGAKKLVKTDSMIVNFENSDKISEDVKNREYETKLRSSRLALNSSQPVRLLGLDKPRPSSALSGKSSDSLTGSGSTNQDAAYGRTGQSKASAQTDKPYQIEDEHHLEFYMGEMSSYMKDKALRRRTSEQGTRINTLWLKSISKAVREQEKKLQGVPETEDLEHRGPFESHEQCPVSVEYEGVCCCEDNKENLVERGVLTCLYREFRSEVTELVDLQLVPVYLFSDTVASGPKCAVDSWATYVSNKRGMLIGLSCFFSSKREGYLYAVYDHVKQLGQYMYTAELVQACMDDQLLYIATKAGVEVYTARTTPYVMHETYDYDHVTKTLPPYNLESCLVGLKPFIAPFSLGLSPNHTVLVSKFVETFNNRDESGWSIYALKRPTTADLYMDMQELSERYKETSAPVYRHLLQEMHLLARGATFRGPNTEQTTFTRAEESAMMLAELYARSDSDHPELTIPYLMMTHLPYGQIVHKLTNNGDTLGTGLWQYLDYILQENQHTLNMSMEDGDVVLKLYSKERPHQLSSVLLHSKLADYTTELALSCLLSWLETPESKSSRNRNLDVLSGAILYLRMGDLGDAEATLFSLPEANLIETCVANHEVLHLNYSTFSPLAQMLRRHKPEVFLRILVGLHDAGTIVMETAINIFRGESSGSSHMMEYLEMMLSDCSRHYIFHEACPLVIDMYIERLSNPSTKTHCDVSGFQTLEKLLKGQGHFSPRHSWLDSLPPFNGTLRKSCQKSARSHKLLVGVSSASPALSISKASSGSDSEGQDLTKAELCSCMMCNVELLKLQSLLCSQYTTKDMCREMVNKMVTVSEVSSATVLPGAAALWLLCKSKTDPLDAIEKVIEKYPTIICSFVTQTYGEIHHYWPIVMEKILLKVENLEKEMHEDYQLYKQVLSDVLAVLVEILSPADFANLLPENGSMAYFGHYLERSVTKQQAAQLKRSIIAAV